MTRTDPAAPPAGPYPAPPPSAPSAGPYTTSPPPAGCTVRDLPALRDALCDRVPGWLRDRRWFAGKDTPLAAVTPVLAELVVEGPAALLLAVVRAGHDELYQLLVGVRDEPPPGLGDDVRIGRAELPGGRRPVLYEATGDAELMGRLLDRIARGDRVGVLRFEHGGGPLPTGLPGRAGTAEQSNSSVLYGDRALLKVLRRPTPGPSPELELLAALDRAGGVRAAAPLGWIRSAPGGPGGGTTLAILQEFVPSRGDGWQLAVEAARACVAGECETVAPLGGFAEEARALGRATARVHAALAAQLGSRAPSPAEAGALVTALGDRLTEALRELPELGPFERPLRSVQRSLAEAVRRGDAPPVQRVHGDLHLGQALRAEDDWVLIDFEGEPGHSVGERRRPQPVLRDVAAMLRSFDYAAHHALAGLLGAPPGAQSPQDLRGTRLARRASAWAVHNRRAFCAGYAEAGGADPRRAPVLLRAFEADKAVYEAVYEARNRPEWLPIPLAAVRRLAHGRLPAG
ncbi:maltokinase [Streptomyces sp. NPDC007818]|uniref:maltokinase N-terminal cap-like domain-containing protein n=1 Tax=Streptomyces sp. NPDC007818 TaxID=3364780 RepID=UPI0036CB84BB